MYLGYPFAFPLGGEGLSSGLPWIVNMIPSQEATSIKILRPIRFSIRDSETYIQPTSMRVRAGYAKIFSNAETLFDTLPRTKRVALAPGVAPEPLISLTGGHVQIERTGSGAQRSVYSTSIDAGNGYKSVMLTAVFRPDVLTGYVDAADATPLVKSLPSPPYSPFDPVSSVSGLGTVLALEHGPRNKVVYLRCQKSSTNDKTIRLTSCQQSDGTSVINSSIAFDWSALQRYIIVWNENEGYLEVYGQLALSTQRLFRVFISAIPTMPDDYVLRAGSPDAVTALYGQLGPSGDRSTWENIAVTVDVGFPVLGNIRPGDFLTYVRGAELVGFLGDKDPRDADISPWFTAPSSILADPDSGASTSLDNGKFKLIKPAADKTFAIYREEPALLASNSEGFMFNASIFSEATRQDGAATGMGITVYDGQTVFQIQLFNDVGSRTVGILKKNGSDEDITEHFLPTTLLDWSAGAPFRVVFDSRNNALRIYGSDLSTPLLDLSIDRSLLPDGSDYGWDGLTPFVLIGHTMPTTTTGTLNIKSFNLCHLYQAWDAAGGHEPDDAPTSPIFTEQTTGGASSTTADGALTIDAPAGAHDKFHRSLAFFGNNRGGILEVRLQITQWRPLTKTGLYFLMDDGVRVYAVTFIDTTLGKFVALSRRDGLGEFQETTGRDGDAATVSFLLDWSQPHTYRLERRPFEGLRLFVDDEVEPRINYPETKLSLLPDPMYAGTPTMAFGQFSSESSISKWSFVHGFFSRGYEIAFRKNKSDAVLRTELVNTQAIIVANAVDAD